MTAYAEPVAAGMAAPDLTRRAHSTTATGSKNATGRAWLRWFLRLLVAVPAAAVSLQHVHETAQHFGQSGAMGWAEAVGMEAVTALALMELDELRHRRSGRDGAGLPWCLLLSAVLLSLGSNVFAVLQQGGPSRSFGGVVYGGWPTLAFLAVAWLWHAQVSREAAEQLAAEAAAVDAEQLAAEAAAVDAEQLADVPQWPTKKAAIEDLTIRDLKIGREPSPAAIARVVSQHLGPVTPQYAGRIIGEVKALATAAA